MPLAEGGRQLRGPRPVGTARRVQGERERHDRASPHLGSGAARHAGTRAAASRDDRAGAEIGRQRLEHGEPGAVERRGGRSQARPGDAPRLVDEHDDPAGGDHGVARREDVEGPPETTGTVPEHERTGGDAVRPAQRRPSRSQRGVDEPLLPPPAHPAPPSTSPVIGSTTPTSSSGGTGSSSWGPFERLLLTAVETG